jgi:hypothetical protein
MTQIREWLFAVAVVAAVAAGLLSVLMIRLTAFPQMARHHEVNVTLPDSRPAAAGARRGSAS